VEYKAHIRNKTEKLKKGSGYATARGSLNLKTYSTTSCNITVMHEENAAGEP